MESQANREREERLNRRTQKKEEEEMERKRNEEEKRKEIEKDILRLQRQELISQRELQRALEI